MEVLLVVEVERGVVDDADPPLARRFSGPEDGGGWSLQRGRLSRRFQDGIDIDIFLYLIAEPLIKGLRWPLLCRRNEAQMALFDFQGRVVAQIAKGPYPGTGLQHLAHPLLMTRSTNVVEDDPRDGQLLVEVSTAERDRRGTRGHALGIDHQYDRSTEQSRDVSRAAPIVVRSITVE